jgi:DNA-binding response OmpR family regulator
MELSGIAVLVVEDDFNLARSLAALLASHGAEVVGPVPSVARALELLAGRSVDVAVLDVQLRGETVAPVAERLHADRVPIVFLTGVRDLGQLPDRFERYPRLDKPVDRHGLLSTVRTVRRNRE